MLADVGSVRVRARVCVWHRNNQHGSWPMANQQMYTALKYAGYDVKLEWGEGNHSGAHGASVLPDTLRWLWGPAAAKL